MIAPTLAISCTQDIKGSMEGETVVRLQPEAMDERLRALYRAASPTEKLAAVARINLSLTAIKEAAVARQHPEWSPVQRRSAVRRWWLSSHD